jgi:hypothetical protein
MRRPRLLGTGAALVVLLLSGCGGDGDELEVDRPSTDAVELGSAQRSSRWIWPPAVVGRVLDHE